MKSALREVFQRPSRLPPIDMKLPGDDQSSELEYDAKADRGWRRYFQRPDIQRFLVQSKSAERYRGEGLKGSMPASEKTYMTIDVASAPYLWTNPVTRLNQQKIEQESTTTMGNEKTNDGQTRRSYNNKAGRGEPSMKKTTSQNTLSVTVLNKKASPRLDDSLDDSPLNRLPDTTALNKLSYRKLAMATPSTAKLRDRENRFVNDAISTNAGRTRYRDIIPRYDAAHDLHCQDYFRRTDVRNLIGVTCTLKPGEKDVKFRR